jgi:hypothetical protein
MGRVSDEPRAPLTTTTSIWPAAGVLIFAAVVLGVFMVINLISDQGVTKTPATVPVVVGGLAKAPSTAVLNDCKSSSEVPSNINEFVGGQRSQRRRRRLRLLPAAHHDHQRRVTTQVLQIPTRGPRLESVLTGFEQWETPVTLSKGWQRRFLLGRRHLGHEVLEQTGALDIPDLSKLRNGLSQFLFGRDGFRARPGPEREVERVDHVADACRGRDAHHREKDQAENGEHL